MDPVGSFVDAMLSWLAQIAGAFRAITFTIWGFQVNWLSILVVFILCGMVANAFWKGERS